MEIKTPLLKSYNEDGDALYSITPKHTYADVIRYLLEENSPNELKYLIESVAHES